MARDIEKIIETVDVPEMEYTKSKQKTISAEVPEVILPKTKAEMYEEAKSRLTRETKAVSKDYSRKKKDRQKKQQSVKTVDLESAVSKAVGAQSNERHSQERKNAEELKKHGEVVRQIVSQPKWVGSAEELIPFSWQHPLVDVVKPSKYYRNAMKEERSRAMLLPVPHDGK